MNPNNYTPPGGPNRTPTPTTFPPLEVDPNPARTGHRRAHSDNSFRFSLDEEDDFLFDIDNFNFSSFDILSPHHHRQQQVPPVTVDSATSSWAHHNDNNPSGGASGSAPHVRSLSVDSEFFDGVSFGGKRVAGSDGGGERRLSGPHRRASSMDGSSSSMFEGGDYVMDGIKKTNMPPEKLAELALVDPKRAKRILANRQSAQRSKERKLRYTGELERQVQALQTEATALSSHLNMLKSDTSGLTTENKELKLRLEALKQQAQLRHALNDTLRQEVQRLRISTGWVPSGYGNVNQGAVPQFSTTDQNMTSFGTQQQPPPHPQPQPQQFQMPSSSNQNISEQPNFMDFDRRG